MEVDGPMFDLDDHIGFELPVEGMKDVICGSGAIIFWVAPIEMMVIDKGAIKKETVVRCQGTSDSVSSVGGSTAVGGWAGLAFWGCRGQPKWKGEYPKGEGYRRCGGVAEESDRLGRADRR